MSSPIDNFAKLSITRRMQPSRGQTRGTARGRDKGKAPALEDDSNSDEVSDHESDEELDPGLDEEGTDITWSGRVFALDHCRQHGTRYAFQIAYAEVERYSIRIGTTDSGIPTCSCKEEGTCRHIMWFLEQLSRTQAEEVEGTTPYQHISNIGLRNVCEELHWELREGTDSDTEEPHWQLKKDYSSTEVGRQTRGMVKERMNAVRDIMATFSTVVTDDYRKDIFKSSDDITMEDVLAENDLEKTISQLLILDDNFFYQMKAMVPRDARASDYFRKMAVKAQTTCHLLDRYCEDGPAAGKHDLIWCAQELVNIVNAISGNVTARQPLSPASREEAAKALTSILGMVVRERNHDVYQNLKWTRRASHAEPQIARNLYQRLIGSTSQANPSGGGFVIKALQDLPEAQRCVEDLEEILAILSTIGWGPAPLVYRDKLSGLISQLKGASGPSTSSGKRHASTMDRNVKRMK